VGKVAEVKLRIAQRAADREAENNRADAARRAAQAQANTQRPYLQRPASGALQLAGASAAPRR